MKATQNKQIYQCELNKLDERMIKRFLQYIQIEAMQFLICPKHNKVEKAAHKVTTNCYICMNRYCQESFLPLCQACKSDHRDHSNKILTLEDITFLIERLLKSPFKELTCYIDEAVGVMKKFKLIQENKRKIEVLEREIFNEVIGLVECTEGLIHEYAVCKNKVMDLGDVLGGIETMEGFGEFKKNSAEWLVNLEYNYQKDKFEYGNQIIREKYEQRRKSYQRTKRRLQEVKDYSMKIIEVILANDDSEQEEEDIIYKKKMYQILKRDLLTLVQKDKLKQIEKEKEKQHQKQKEIQLVKQKEKQTAVIVNQPKSSSLLHSYSTTTNRFYGDNLHSHNVSTLSEQTVKQTMRTMISSCHQSSVLSIEKSCQTGSQWIRSVEESVREMELKMRKMEQSNAKGINELQNKIHMLVKEKQLIKKQCSTIQSKYKLKNQRILQIETKLRENKQKRLQKQQQRQVKLNRLIQIAGWRGLLEGDVIG